MVTEKELVRLAEKIKKELNESEQTYLIGVVEGIKLSNFIKKMEG